MKWLVLPRQSEPQKMAIIFIATLLVAVMGYVLTHRFLLVILAPIVIALSTAEFWLGTTYILDEEKAEASVGFSGSVILWKDVNLVKLDQSHIYLSPFADECRLDAYRGVKLNLTNVNRESIIEYVRERVSKDVRFLG